MKNEHAILGLCQELEVSPSGYHDWHLRSVRPGRRAVEDEALARAVRKSAEAYCPVLSTRRR